MAKVPSVMWSERAILERGSGLAQLARQHFVEKK